MHWPTAFSLLVLSGAQAFPWPMASKRASTTDATLYAYGTNISGYPVLYDATNGGLYISGANVTIAGLQSISWDIPSMHSASTTTTTATMHNGTSAGGLHLDTSNTGVSQVTVSSNATAGVTLYGSQLVYISGTSFESKFWGQEMQINGTTAFEVTWNQQNALENGLTPLSLKTLGPSVTAT